MNTSSNPSLHNEYYTLNGSTVNFDTLLSVTASPLVATPEPGTMLLVGSALTGLGALMRKWRNQ